MLIMITKLSLGLHVQVLSIYSAYPASDLIDGFWHALGHHLGITHHKRLSTWILVALEQYIIGWIINLFHRFIDSFYSVNLRSPIWYQQRHLYAIKFRSRNPHTFWAFNFRSREVARLYVNLNAILKEIRVWKTLSWSIIYMALW